MSQAPAPADFAAGRLDPAARRGHASGIRAASAVGAAANAVTQRRNDDITPVHLHVPSRALGQRDSKFGEVHRSRYDVQPGDIADFTAGTVAILNYGARAQKWEAATNALRQHYQAYQGELDVHMVYWEARNISEYPGIPEASRIRMIQDLYTRARDVLAADHSAWRLQLDYAVQNARTPLASQLLDMARDKLTSEQFRATLGSVLDSARGPMLKELLPKLLDLAKRPLPVDFMTSVDRGIARMLRAEDADRKVVRDMARAVVHRERPSGPGDNRGDGVSVEKA